MSKQKSQIEVRERVNYTLIVVTHPNGQDTRIEVHPDRVYVTTANKMIIEPSVSNAVTIKQYPDHE